MDQEDEIAFSGIPSRADYRKIASATVIAEGKASHTPDEANIEVKLCHLPDDTLDTGSIPSVEAILAEIPHTRVLTQPRERHYSTYIVIRMPLSDVKTAIDALSKVCNTHTNLKYSEERRENAIGKAGADAVSRAERIVAHQAAASGHRIHHLIDARHLAHSPPEVVWDGETQTFNWTVKMAVTFCLEKIDN